MVHFDKDAESESVSSLTGYNYFTKSVERNTASAVFEPHLKICEHLDKLSIGLFRELFF